MKKKYPWEIHYVTDNGKGKDHEAVFIPGMCDAHTHGLDRFGSLELQVVISLPPNLMGYLFNAVGDSIRNGLVLEDGAILSGYFENDIKIKVFKTKDTYGAPVFRLILPDEKLRFPEESDQHPYMMQYKSPYISGLSS